MNEENNLNSPYTAGKGKTLSRGSRTPGDTSCGVVACRRRYFRAYELIANRDLRIDEYSRILSSYLRHLLGVDYDCYSSRSGP